MSQARTAKQQRSEQKRALALEEKRTLNSQKSNLNISTPQGTHTVFESDHNGSDSDRELEEKSKALEKKAKVKKTINGAYEKKITGKIADQWLGFSSGDEENTNGTEPDLPSKPQFEGKHGEKLMRLQRRIGQDKRFEVTPAFLEESSDDSSDEQEGVENDFEMEKSMSLAVLQSLMGSKVIIRKNKETRNKREVMNVQRYDPDDERCADLEVKDESRLAIDDLKMTKKSDQISTTVEHPVVSEDRFYTVCSELDFSDGKRKQTHSFSFLDVLETQHEEVDSSTTRHNAKMSKKLQTKKSLLQQLDSSSDEESKVRDDQQTPQTEDIQQSVDSDNGFFFLYDSTGNLKGRLANGVRHFMRTESVEEMESKWKFKRKFLLQDYKKKRKDTLRRLKRSRVHKCVFKN